MNNAPLKKTRIAAITSALLLIAASAHAQSVPDAEVFRSLLKTLNFEYNSSELTQSSYAALDSIAALFMRSAGLRYEVQGHSDSIGSAKYNELLSGARAAAVRNYIISKGVSGASVVAIGYGSAKPVAGNETEKGRAANRRVEILLIESQEKYERLKESETKQQEDIKKAGIAVAAVPEQTPEPPQAARCECEKPEKPRHETEERTVVSQKKHGKKMSIGVAGLFAGDFGGGFNMPAIDVGGIKIPGAKVNTPWMGGGGKAFFDATYAEAGVGLVFGGGEMQMSAVEVGWSFAALSLGLLGKFPFELAGGVSMFPAAGIDYQRVLSMKTEKTAAADAGSNSALWFKFGAGMDISAGDLMFIRPMLLYGIRQPSEWEGNSAKPIIAGGKSGSTLLGHGFTLSVGIGFRL